MCIADSQRWDYDPYEEAEPVPHRWVTDHGYMGNLCSGFGGETRCEYTDFDTGHTCGQSPASHVTDEELQQWERVLGKHLLRD